ncbi:MAG: preprotein translocase subunit YajC [Prevotellaceae bacterium]|nr:preprotein translocase subunit YajC [Candidatus Colivivens caballi]
MFILLQEAGGAGFLGSSGGSILMIVLMFVILYFFMIRPQQKRQKEIQKFRNSLTVGSKVLTAGGVYGTVKSLNEGETYLTVEIAKGVTIQIERSSVFADTTQQPQQQ